jgi:hypothetical protein
VVPSKYGELIQSSNQIPPGSNVASYEDPKGEDRERVHESAAIAHTLLSLGFVHLRLQWPAGVNATKKVEAGLLRRDRYSAATVLC